MKKLFAICALCLMVSCTLDIPPADQYSDPDAITDVKSARSLLASAYMLYPHNEFELSVLGNDFCQTSLINNQVDLHNLYLWREDQIRQTADQLWLGLYKTISTCDILLERMDNVSVSTKDEEREKADIYAETKALRAMCYFDLLRIFAPPYDINPEADGVILKTRAGLEFPKRSSIRICTEFIRHELQEVASVPGVTSSNGWINPKAVLYLQAELELYAGNYQQVVTLVQKLLQGISSNLYRQYAKLWQKDSFDGRIFAFYHSGPYYNELQYQEKEGDYFAINPVWDTFSDSDVRKSGSLYTFSMEGSERTLLGKYNRNNKEGSETFYINRMRYSGAVFMAAEAYARMKGEETKGLQLLNEYLQACDAMPLDAQIKGEALIDAVLDQKYKEFFGEGMNFYDLKRTHRNTLPRLDKWGKNTIDVIRPDDYRWTFPIPRSECRYNTNVTQNNGWN